MATDDRPAAPGLWLYSTLSRWDRVGSYRGKIMAVAFLGTHVPLLALVGYVVLTAGLPAGDAARLLLVALLATLLGTAATLFALHHLLAPVARTAQALRAYLADRILPALPTHFTDDAGALMADTVHTLGRLDDAITQLDTFDKLTALPNGAVFLDRAAGLAGTVAVVQVDLTGFAGVNAALGQAAGDSVLRAAAQRLAAAAPAGGVTARLGGDEFAVLVPLPVAPGEVPDVDALGRDVGRLLAELGRPFPVLGRDVHVGASAGVAVGAGADAAELLARSAGALADAKAAGPGQFRFHSPDDTDRLRRRHALEVDLRGALDRGEFVLHFQPKVSAGAREVTGAEALVRWRHPARGLVPPGEFIPVAEATGLIVPLGEWVLRAACAEAARWPRNLTIAVNLSARQFQQPDLPRVVAQALADAGLDPSRLELEVTESTVMGDAARALATLTELRGIGVSLALDDFGTGHSSLAYLKRFPFQVLKVDRAFVRDLPAGGEDLAIVRATIALARALGLDVVAEGVEGEAQAECLERNGCDALQGFYFSRPLPADALRAFVRPGVGAAVGGPPAAVLA